MIWILVALLHTAFAAIGPGIATAHRACRFYDFRIDSDDGSNLWIDGSLAISNGGALAGCCNAFAMSVTLKYTLT